MLFALCQGQFHFGVAAFGKVDAERNEGEALELSFSDQFADLLAMQQELPLAKRIVIHQVAVRVGADVAMVQVYFTVIDRRKTILEVHTALAQGLHLSSTQENAGLELFFDKVVVVGLSITGHHFILVVFILSLRHIEWPTAVSLRPFWYDVAMRGQSRLDSFGTILAGVAHRLGLESKLFEARLRRHWPEIVGEPIATHTRPHQIRFKKLHVYVHNSVWLQQLTFLKPVLLEKVNRMAGEQLVAEIVLRIGEFSADTTTSAPPAALEATPPQPSAELLREAILHTQGIQDPALREQLAAVMVQALSVTPPASSRRGP